MIGQIMSHEVVRLCHMDWVMQVPYTIKTNLNRQAKPLAASSYWRSTLI